MKQKPSQLIILGGGSSVREGITKGLWNKLKGRFVIGCNYSHKYFQATFQSFVDKRFYDAERKYMESLPLIIGKKHSFLHKKMPNTILLPATTKYYRDIKNGIYTASLTGLYSLTLGIYLLDEGELFLLGFDFGEAKKDKHDKNAISPYDLQKSRLRDKKGRLLTHFYQDDIQHPGVARVHYYNTKDRAKRAFAPYEEEKKVKIYNVSINSKISAFPKINYNEFYKKLDNHQYDQDELRKWIRNILKKEKK